MAAPQHSIRCDASRSSPMSWSENKTRTLKTISVAATPMPMDRKHARCQLFAGETKYVFP